MTANLPGQGHQQSLEDILVATRKIYHSAQELFHPHPPITTPGAWPPIPHPTPAPLLHAKVPLTVGTFQRLTPFPPPPPSSIIHTKGMGKVMGHLCIQTLGVSLADPLISRKRGTFFTVIV